jgi:hypothetical protein
METWWYSDWFVLVVQPRSTLRAVWPRAGLTTSVVKSNLYASRGGLMKHFAKLLCTTQQHCFDHTSPALVCQPRLV